jgi:hypothetical protein
MNPREIQLLFIVVKINGPALICKGAWQQGGLQNIYSRQNGGLSSHYTEGKKYTVARNGFVQYS